MKQISLRRALAGSSTVAIAVMAVMEAMQGCSSSNPPPLTGPDAAPDAPYVPPADASHPDTGAGPAHDSGSDATLDSGASDGGAVSDATMDATSPGDASSPSDAGFDSGWTVTLIDPAAQRDFSGVWGTDGVADAGDGGGIVYAVGIQEEVYASMDKGSSWQPVTVGLSSDQFSAVWGTGPSNVYIVSETEGASVVYWYNGSSWTSVATSSGESFFAIWGSSATDIYLVGAGGTILHSSNGTTFTPQTSPTTTDLIAIWGNSASDVYAVGGSGGVVGEIVHTSGGGVWTEQVSDAGVGEALDGVWGPAPGTAYVSDLQASVLYVTTNSGAAWSLGPAIPSASVGLYGIWGSSASDFYVASASTSGALLLHSSGGALTIEPVTFASGGFAAVWGSSASGVYVVGSGGYVAHKSP